MVLCVKDKMQFDDVIYFLHQQVRQRGSLWSKPKRRGDIVICKGISSGKSTYTATKAGESSLASSSHATPDRSGTSATPRSISTTPDSSTTSATYAESQVRLTSSATSDERRHPAAKRNGGYIKKLSQTKQQMLQRIDTFIHKEKTRVEKVRPDAGEEVAVVESQEGQEVKGHSKSGYSSDKTSSSGKTDVVDWTLLDRAVHPVFKDQQPKPQPKAQPKPQPKAQPGRRNVFMSDQVPSKLINAEIESFLKRATKRF